jgi:hypothetical protein
MSPNRNSSLNPDATDVPVPSLTASCRGSRPRTRKFCATSTKRCWIKQNQQTSSILASPPMLHPRQSGRSMWKRALVVTPQCAVTVGKVDTKQSDAPRLWRVVSATESDTRGSTVASTRSSNGYLRSALPDQQSLSVKSATSGMLESVQVQSRTAKRVSSILISKLIHFAKPASQLLNTITLLV